MRLLPSFESRIMQNPEDRIVPNAVVFFGKIGWRPAVLIPRPGIHSGVDEGLHHSGGAMLRRRVQRGPAVLGPRPGIRSGVDEGLHYFGVAPLHCQVSKIACIGCWIGSGNAPANFATIRQAAMNLLRRAFGKLSLIRKRHSAAWDDNCMEAILRQ